MKPLNRVRACARRYVAITETGEIDWCTDQDQAIKAVKRFGAEGKIAYVALLLTTNEPSLWKDQQS